MRTCMCIPVAGEWGSAGLDEFLQTKTINLTLEVATHAHICAHACIKTTTAHSRSMRMHACTCTTDGHGHARMHTHTHARMHVSPRPCARTCSGIRHAACGTPYAARLMHARARARTHARMRVARMHACVAPRARPPASPARVACMRPHTRCVHACTRAHLCARVHPCRNTRRLSHRRWRLCS